MRKIVVLGVVLGAGIIGMPSQASADRGSNLGGCTPNMQLATVEETVFGGIIDLRPYPEDIWDDIVLDIEERADFNDDGLVCWSHRKPNAGQDKFWGGFEDYVVTAISDNLAVGLG